MNGILTISVSVSTEITAPLDGLAHAIWHLGGARVAVLEQSSVYLVPAMPEGHGPARAVEALLVRTAQGPTALRETLDLIEAALGAQQGLPQRVKAEIIALDDRIDPGPPPLPHPKLDTAEVLVPLAEIAPDRVIKPSDRTVAERLAALPQAERARIRLYSGAEELRDVAE